MFGIEQAGAPSLDVATADHLEQFMRENDLVLVHWPSRTLFDSPATAANCLKGKKN